GGGGERGREVGGGQDGGGVGVQDRQAGGARLVGVHLVGVRQGGVDQVHQEVAGEQHPFVGGRQEHRLVAGGVPGSGQQSYRRGQGCLAVDHPELAGGAQRREQPGRQPRVDRLRRLQFGA